MFSADMKDKHVCAGQLCQGLATFHKHDTGILHECIDKLIHDICYISADSYVL